MQRLTSTILIVTILSWLVGCTPNKADEQDVAITVDEWKMKAADGVRLYVKEFGSGDTVVVIHGGFGAEHGYLVNAFLPFAQKHHFILYDQRGSLRSRCEDSMITVAKHVQDIEALRKETGQDQLVIVAHSMGGYLAMRYACTYPGKVKKLVLISSPPAKCNIDSLTTKISEPAMARWQRPAVVEELGKYGVKDAKGDYTDRMTWIRDRITFGAINLHDVTKWREIKGGPLFYNGSAGQAASSSMESDNWNYISCLKQQQIPIYIIHGDDDYLPYTYHDAWKDSLDGTHFNLISNAGHCLWIDNFTEYKQVFNKALDQ